MSERWQDLCRMPRCTREHLSSGWVPLCHTHHEDFIASPECARAMDIRDRWAANPHWMDARDQARCAAAVVDFVVRVDREAHALNWEERKLSVQSARIGEPLLTPEQLRVEYAKASQKA